MISATPFITKALGLAAQALFLSSPNPRVGCVIAAPDDRVLGEGRDNGCSGHW